MAENTTRYTYTPPVSNAEKLRQAYISLEQTKKMLASAKVGSKEYIKYKKQYDLTQKSIKEYTDASNKEREEAAAKAKAKADAAKIKKLEEAAARAKDYGTPAEATKAEQELNDYKTKNPVAEEGYVGTGSKDKPLTYKGKNYTGTYKGKEYKNGVLVKATSVKDSDGDGIPDTVDATPNKPTVIKPPAGGGTGGGGGGGQTTPPPAEDSGVKVKDLWMSYLRTTFGSLEDKTQKAEIDLLLKRAKDENWDEDTFMEALEGTVWWQATYPSIRSFFLETHDPRNASTFAEKVSNTMDSMMGKLEALGITVRQVDPATGKVIDNTDFVKGIALKSIENNWDDDQLEQYLATQGNILFSGGGTLGSYYDRIAQQAYLYGVPLDETMKQTINTSLLDPMDGRDANYWIKTVKDMAYDAPQNKPFLASLQAGRNLYEVTNSYRQQMANLLEVDSTAITWNDLMGKVVDTTTGNARTFADFTKQLKSDPLWQYTRNAKETYSNTALDIAKMFGFVG
jgi:hypothetical protein